jgi:hypothetical protein
MTVTMATAAEAPPQPDPFQRESAVVTEITAEAPVFDSGSGFGKSPPVILQVGGIRCWRFSAWTGFAQVE